MGKFSTVVQGTRARKPVKLPLPGAQYNVEKNEWVGPVEDLVLRALRDDEHADVVTEAKAFAIKRGVENPEDGDPLYEKGKMLHTLALACLDKDSPLEKPEPYFDLGWEQIHKAENLTPEVIAYLYFQQQLWQDEVNPLNGSLNNTEFMAAAIKTAQGDMSFFVNSRPGIRWSFTRTLASQLVASHARSLQSSSSSEPQKETRS